MSDNTPYEDGDGTEVARLARERRCDDLVWELRRMGGPLSAPIVHAAADEIERLRARVAELERRELERDLTNRNAKL